LSLNLSSCLPCKRALIRLLSYLYLLGTLFSFEIAQAEIYKCPSADGTLFYTDIACPIGEEKIKHHNEWVSREEYENIRAEKKEEHAKKGQEKHAVSSEELLIQNSNASGKKADQAEANRQISEHQYNRGLISASEYRKALVAAKNAAQEDISTKKNLQQYYSDKVLRISDEMEQDKKESEDFIRKYGS